MIATKVFVPLIKVPNGGCLFRKHIMHQIDQSLKRLSMEYDDLYIIHRWDYHNPIEETMEILHDIVKTLAHPNFTYSQTESKTKTAQHLPLVSFSDRMTPTRIEPVSSDELFYGISNSQILPSCADRKEI